MRFSVAMCTYNGAAFLPQQLESLAAQQRLPDELVVCDDGSTDRTVELLEAFRDRAPFPVRLICNAVNLGYSRNFSKAAGLCTGGLIALADQDDVWYPQKLSRLEAAFLAEPQAEGVFSDGDLLGDNPLSGKEQPTGRTLWQSFLFSPAEQARLQAVEAVPVLLRRNVVTGMAFAFRASARDLFDSMPPSWIHDGWLAMGIALRSRLVALPERLVAYRLHGTQQVGTPPTLPGKLRTLRSGGPFHYLSRTHARNLDEYQRTALQFDDLAQWLEASEPKHPALAAIRDKAAHAHRGARALSVSRWRRWPILLPHAASYRRYSPNGQRGLPRDLIC